MMTDALTPAQMRVAIAKKAASLIACPHVHTSRINYVFGYMPSLPEVIDGELQDQGIRGTLKDINFCLIGACLIAKAILFGGVPMRAFEPYDGDCAYIPGGRVARLLKAIFPFQMLAMMEAAYIQSDDLEHYRKLPVNMALVRGSLEFGRRFDTEPSRDHVLFNTTDAVALAILANIIANDGEFVVTPIPEGEGSNDD